MEQTNKNSKGLIIALIICLIVIVTLSGYIIYDKYFNQSGENANVKTTETTKKENQEEASRKKLDTTG